MGINFPNSPSVGQQWPSPAVAGLPVYQWDGEKWTAGPPALQYYTTADGFVAVTPVAGSMSPNHFVFYATGLTNFKAWAEGGIWRANARM